MYSMGGDDSQWLLQNASKSSSWKDGGRLRKRSHPVSEIVGSGPNRDRYAKFSRNFTRRKKPLHAFQLMLPRNHALD